MVKNVDAITDDVFEVSSQKRQIKDNKLTHVGSAVLQLSKLHLLRYAHFLHEYLVPNSFKILYLGNS